MNLFFSVCFLFLFFVSHICCYWAGRIWRYVGKPWPFRSEKGYTTKTCPRAGFWRAGPDIDAWNLQFAGLEGENLSDIYIYIYVYIYIYIYVHIIYIYIYIYVYVRIHASLSLFIEFNFSYFFILVTPSTPSSHPAIVLFKKSWGCPWWTFDGAQDREIYRNIWKNRFLCFFFVFLSLFLAFVWLFWGFCKGRISPNGSQILLEASKILPLSIFFVLNPA